MLVEDSSLDDIVASAAGPSELAAGPGSGGVKYQSAQSGYHFNWKTTTAWASTCRRFDIELTDGAIYSAWFEFT